MKLMLGCLLAVAVGCGVAAGQCPTLKMYAPSSDVKVGDEILFTLGYDGGDPKVDPKFEWAVSDGKIKDGQGTVVIKVDTSAAVGNMITASVDVKGYADSCRASVSTFATLVKPPPAEAPRKIDTFGQLKPSDEQLHLDTLAILLQGDPDLTGYIVGYAGKKSHAGDTKAALERMKNALVKTGGLAPTRIVTIDGGARKDAAFELWTGLPGATPPTPAPDKE